MSFALSTDREEADALNNAGSMKLADKIEPPIVSFSSKVCTFKQQCSN